MGRESMGSRAGYLLLLALCACAKSHSGQSSTTGSGATAGSSAAKAGGTGGKSAASGGAGKGKLPTQGSDCLVSSVTVDIAVTDNDKLDLLLMVDNSDFMAPKQEKLQKQLPRLVTILTTGDKDGDGVADIPPVKDMHLGVVTSDMGLPGVAGIVNCIGLGNDGILEHTPRSLGASGCEASYPPFLSYQAGTNQPNQTAADFSCIAAVGTDGCGFEHPLEAVLKALWPRDDSRVQFLIDPATGEGSTGHGGPGENAGFLRSNSILAVVLLTDEDDCSSSDTRPFTPPQYLDPNDPVAMQGMQVRCHYNQQALYPIERYVNGLKALRPGNENLVVFAAITGVPEDLVSDSVRSATDSTSSEQRSAFYAKILGDQRMQEAVDTQGTPDPSDDVLKRSCGSGMAGATPPIRIAKTAEGFGPNGVLASICADDYGSAIDAIVDAIAPQLLAACLPRPLARQASGLVACKVTWELPRPGSAPAATPITCGGMFPFLLAPAAGQAQTTDAGGQICEVAQLAVRGDASGNLAPMPTETSGQRFEDGWYYDDFSDLAHTRCNSATKQLIAFTPGAKPPAGVTVKLSCLNETSIATGMPADSVNGMACSSGSKTTSNANVGRRCLPESVPGAGFDDREAYVETASPDCDGGACLVYKLNGNPLSSCVPNASPVVCATAADVKDRVYCSCRCDAPAGYAACACPDGYACIDILDQGSDDVRGGYCVKNGTYAP